VSCSWAIPVGLFVFPLPPCSMSNNHPDSYA
jgi:hypothetical protein